LAHLGWILAPKTKSCSAACSDQVSICHVASQQAVNSKAEFKFALGQAGLTSVANSLATAQYFSFPRATDPSVILPAADKAMQYVGASSTCDALPAGDLQRLCCSSPTGCATSA
jgi:hypothetical protein